MLSVRSISSIPHPYATMRRDPSFPKVTLRMSAALAEQIRQASGETVPAWMRCDFRREHGGYAPGALSGEVSNECKEFKEFELLSHQEEQILQPESEAASTSNGPVPVVLHSRQLPRAGLSRVSSRRNHPDELAPSSPAEAIRAAPAATAETLPAASTTS